MASLCRGFWQAFESETCSSWQTQACNWAQEESPPEAALLAVWALGHLIRLPKTLSIAVWFKAVLAPSHVADLPPILNVSLDYLTPYSAFSFRWVALPLPSSNSILAPAARIPQLTPHGTSLLQFHQLLQSWPTHEVSRGLDFSRWAWRGNRGAKKWRVPSVAGSSWNMEATLGKKNETLRRTLLSKLVVSQTMQPGHLRAGDHLRFHGELHLGRQKLWLKTLHALLTWGHSPQLSKEQMGTSLCQALC